MHTAPLRSWTKLTPHTLHLRFALPFVLCYFPARYRAGRALDVAVPRYFSLPGRFSCIALYLSFSFGSGSGLTRVLDSRLHRGASTLTLFCAHNFTARATPFRSRTTRGFSSVSFLGSCLIRCPFTCAPSACLSRAAYAPPLCHSATALPLRRLFRLLFSGSTYAPLCFSRGYAHWFTCTSLPGRSLRHRFAFLLRFSGFLSLPLSLRTGHAACTHRCVSCYCTCFLCLRTFPAAVWFATRVNTPATPDTTLRVVWTAQHASLYAHCWVCSRTCFLPNTTQRALTTAFHHAAYAYLATHDI